MTPAQWVAKEQAKDKLTLQTLEARITRLERHYHYGHSSQCDGPTGGPCIPDE